tara:strand:- start:10 stop:696 length:687 start_codon:yes stop_codon:yes gene_type:complete
MTKYVAYYRVSTTRQGQSGLGLESQQATVEAHVKSLGGELVAEYVESKSGRDNNREQLNKALRECRLTGATLVLAKLDRLSRDRSFLFELTDSKLDFIFCDLPEANRLTIGIIAVMADYESRLISERVTASYDARRARCKSEGIETNFGNADLLTIRNSDSTKARAKWVEQSSSRNTELLEVIGELEERHGKQSTRSMADLLNGAGYTTARGNQFTSGQVSRLRSIAT